MPKRPAKHQIEDQSRARFRLLLPEAWVFRDITPDYGIDGEVEIFDDTGKSTGLSFLVQLKASESKSKDQRRRVTWSYWGIDVQRLLQKRSHTLETVHHFLIHMPDLQHVSRPPLDWGDKQR